MVLTIILYAKRPKADDRRSSCLRDVPSIFFKFEMHWLSAPELDTPENTGLRLVSADTAQRPISDWHPFKPPWTREAKKKKEEYLASSLNGVPACLAPSHHHVCLPPWDKPFSFPITTSMTAHGFPALLLLLGISSQAGCRICPITASRLYAWPAQMDRSRPIDTSVFAPQGGRNPQGFPQARRATC